MDFISKEYKSHSLFILIHCFVYISCIKEADIIQPKMEPKLVLNSFLSPHNPMSFYVSSTKDIGDTILPIIRNATIHIWEDGVLVDSLKSGNQNGLYKSELKPYPLKNYTISVRAPGFKEIIATEYIPKQVLIDSATGTFGEFFDDTKEPLTSVNIIFSDELATNNYYEAQISGIYSDSTWYIPFLQNLSDLALVTEGDQDFHPSSFFFSDDVFKNQKYVLNLKFYGAPKRKVPMKITFRSISKNYYQYRKFWTRHNFNQNDTEFLEDPYDIFFKSEPLPMYTNVQNGLGIVAGYQEQIYKVDVINLLEK